MMMVVLLHVTGFTDMENLLPEFSVKFEIYRGIGIFSIIAVNCFALVSGYTMYREKSEIKLNRLISLYTQVLFYTVLSAIGYYVFFRQVMNPLELIFPITTKRYWYITAYVGVCILSPVLNAAVSNLDQKSYRNWLVIAFLSFSVIPALLHRDTFYMAGGYSAFWLMLLYFVGAYVKKYDVTVSSRKAICCYASVSLFALLVVNAAELAAKYVLGHSTGYGYFIGYTAPLMVISSVLLFIGMKNLRIKSQMVTNIISGVGGLTLGVYLFHLRSPIWELCLNNWIKDLMVSDDFIFLSGIVVISIGIFALGIALDFLRQKVYNLLHINETITKFIEYLFWKNGIARKVNIHFIKRSFLP